MKLEHKNWHSSNHILEGKRKMERLRSTKISFGTLEN
jgi:hypothetical protein